MKAAVFITTGSVLMVAALLLAVPTGVSAQTSTPVPSPTPTTTPTPFWTNTPVATPFATPSVASLSAGNTSGLQSLQSFLNTANTFVSMAETTFEQGAAQYANDFCIVIGVLYGGESLIGSYLTTILLSILAAMVLVMVLRFVIWVVTTIKNVLRFI